MRPFDLCRILAICLGVTSLAACASDTAEETSTSILVAAAVSVKDSVTGGAKSGTSGAGIGLTRATLANVVTPVDLVTIERTGAQALIAKIAINRDVETWSSVDNKTLSMRGGVVLATRGLGDDLMSASVPQVARLQQVGPTYQRAHVVLDGEDKPVTSQFNCSTASNGPETITVVERSYSTVRLTERCLGATSGFSNDYWFDLGGKLRRSRQWISESVGHVVIEHLK